MIVLLLPPSAFFRSRVSTEFRKLTAKKYEMTKVMTCSLCIRVYVYRPIAIFIEKFPKTKRN